MRIYVRLRYSSCLLCDVVLKLVVTVQFAYRRVLSVGIIVRVEKCSGKIQAEHMMRIVVVLQMVPIHTFFDQVATRDENMDLCSFNVFPFRRILFAFRRRQTIVDIAQSEKRTNSTDNEAPRSVQI